MTTVEKTVVALDGVNCKAGLPQNLVGEFNFTQVVIRDANVLDLFALQQRDQVPCPLDRSQSRKSSTASSLARTAPGCAESPQVHVG
jgi:hypothetical protein